MPLFKCSASKARPKNGIGYITDPKKAAIVSVKNLFEDEDYAKQFEETAARFGKGEKMLPQLLRQNRAPGAVLRYLSVRKTI